MKNWIRYTGSALSLGSFVYFGVHIWRYSGNWPDIELGFGGGATVVVLLLSQIGVAIAGALAWRQIVHFSGPTSLGRSKAIAIFCKSQFAKYIPGNVAHHIGRALLAKKEGLSAKRSTLSQTIEVIWNLGCAGMLALYGLTQLITANPDIASLLLEPWVVFLFATASIFGPSLLFPPCIQYLKKRFPRRISPDAAIRIPPLRSLACIAAYFASFLYLGLALNGLAITTLDLPPLELSFAASICALAWVAGFITPGSPAGIGIRDTILLLALKPYYGAEAASALTLAHRVLTTIGDCAVYFFGVLIDKRVQTGS